MEQEVYIADEFTVPCPFCKGENGTIRQGGPLARLINCPCDNGTVTVYVEDTTIVDIEPPEADVP